ncbi:MAG TPA: hypothetical protein VNA87_02180 [Actinomycetota bacterium]|nr:hypothetical protein [Actinomycetota bacterium]
MFPSSFGIAFIVVGLVWIVQGFGLLNTGSFMDRSQLWGFLGLGMTAVGLVLIMIDRKNKGN